ncbi:hypothetical protein [Klebsiella pneumoniae]
MMPHQKLGRRSPVMGIVSGQGATRPAGAVAEANLMAWEQRDVHLRCR